MHGRILLGVFGVSSVALGVSLGCGGATSTDLTEPGNGGASSGATSSGAIPNVGADGGVNPPGAGPGGDTARVTCGATSCATATEVCCVTGNNNSVPPSTSYGCATGACPKPNGGDVTALKCSSAANCPAGSVCCVDKANNGAVSACQTSCGQDQAQLCDPAAGGAGGCPPTAACSSRNIREWGLPSSYATCGGKGN